MTDTVSDEAWLAATKAILSRVPDGYGMTELEATEYARAALEAALPLLVAGEKWLPIETAPQRTRVIIGYDGLTGHWEPRIAFHAVAPDDLDEIGGMEGWFSDEFWTKYAQPTHWMPIPDQSAIRSDTGD